MKRLLPVILSGLMAFPFSACTKKDAAENSAPPAEVMAPESVPTDGGEEMPEAAPEAEPGS